MSFYNIQASNNIAIITEDQIYTYTDLLEKVEQFPFDSNEKKLVLILSKNQIEYIGAYVSALNQNHAVMLMSADTNTDLLDHIVREYKPYWIIGDQCFDGYRQNELIQEKITEDNIQIHTDLAVLLSTSGTTGSQKFVRLSYENILANAEAIVEYLQIDKNERAIMNLPLSYSYGMSIVNSHLLAGATLLLTNQSVMEKSFWSFVEQHEATSLPGVPFTYQMLKRIGFLKKDLPHLKTLIQAGGHLNEKLVKEFGEYTRQTEKRFYVMYGQTEASPRISYIPPSRILDKPSTIGISIPGGELSLDPETSELIYKGPNVMMGYAACLEDLAKGNDLNGILHTGDTAEVDEEGFFSITGRMKRFIKLFGLRINLDEVERKLESSIQSTIACTGNDDKLIIAVEHEQYIETVKVLIEEFYKLHRTAFKVVVLNNIPRFPNGKTDYNRLKEQCL
ncbi:AMP-binding protein [Ureibacillus chungkukjangi]|uniref:AMP-binding protein n=1 Tax=Ureibacillus chungkukjangi TaxID=1202712 RepID=UPI00203DB599|nr:AMP-binding protein [Ureibacillus chungkukjangi]MCM3389792.1 AMP-binding protein [Ureibacillus chungkukjangi]